LISNSARSSDSGEAPTDARWVAESGSVIGVLSESARRAAPAVQSKPPALGKSL
jgi:hypothetical protein